MRISYAVENLRCLKEMELIELKPITVLVGANNSGKSSFLRTIPLLKRSIEASSSLRSPILWRDDNDVVDFNNFVTSVRNYKQEEEIKFHFKIRELEVTDSINKIESRKSNGKIFKKIINSINLTISIAQHEKNTVVRKISLSIPEYDIEAIFEKIGNQREFNKININNFEFKDHFFDAVVIPENREIFSLCHLRHSNGIESDMDEDFIYPRNAIFAHMNNFIVGQLNKVNASNFDINEGLRNILQNPRITDQIVDEWEVSNENKMGSFYRNLFKEDRSLTIWKLDNFCKMYWTLEILNSTMEVLRCFFLSSSYLGPNRIGSKRLYPHLELNVSEISPDGKNLAMYLTSFESPPEKHILNDFSKMVEEILGFKVSVESKPDGVSILIDRKNLKVNLADTGHGISQILPILAQIWESSWNNDIETVLDTGIFPDLDEYLRPITFEQPETHLHPKHQAMIADAIHLSMKEKKSHIKPIYIIETHSKPFISRLGELIEFEGFPRSDIQIVFFSDEQQSENATKASTAFFNDEGVLENWPIGFFEF